MVCVPFQNSVQNVIIFISTGIVDLKDTPSLKNPQTLTLTSLFSRNHPRNQRNLPLQRAHENGGQLLLRLPKGQHLAQPLTPVPGPLRGPRNRPRPSHHRQPRQLHNRRRTRRTPPRRVRHQLRIRREQHTRHLQQRNLVHRPILHTSALQANAETPQKRDGHRSKNQPRNESGLQVQRRVQNDRRWTRERLLHRLLQLRRLDRGHPTLHRTLLSTSGQRRERQSPARGEHGGVRLPQLREEDSEQQTDHVRLQQRVLLERRTTRGHLFQWELESQRTTQMHFGSTPPYPFQQKTKTRGLRRETDDFFRHFVERDAAAVQSYGEDE